MKHCALEGRNQSAEVAPPAGAWIETPEVGEEGDDAGRRPPCGGVD